MQLRINSHIKAIARKLHVDEAIRESDYPTNIDVENCSGFTGAIRISFREFPLERIPRETKSLSTALCKPARSALVIFDPIQLQRVKFMNNFFVRFSRG